MRAERQAACLRTPGAASLNAPIRPSTARRSPIAPRAQATCSRTPASLSFSASTSAGTASDPSSAPSAHALFVRTAGSPSRSDRESSGTALRLPSAPSAHAALVRAIHAGPPSARVSGSYAGVPMATSADAACSPGEVESVMPRERHVRSPQTAGSTGDPSSSSAVSFGSIGAAALPSARRSHAARARGTDRDASPPAAAAGVFCADGASSTTTTAQRLHPHHRVDAHRVSLHRLVHLEVAREDSDSDSEFGIRVRFGWDAGADADGVRAASAADFGDGHRRAAADRRVLVLQRQSACRARVVADLAKRRDHALADVGALVLRGGDQRVDCVAIADLAERAAGCGS
jgi:hypothetical protein